MYYHLYCIKSFLPYWSSTDELIIIITIMDARAKEEHRCTKVGYAIQALNEYIARETLVDQSKCASSSMYKHFEVS